MKYVEEFSKIKGQHKKQKQYDEMRESLYKLIMKAVKGLDPETVLDVGTAYGCLAYMVKKEGYKVKATDVMPELHSEKIFKDNKIEFEEHNIETDKLKEEYDLILFLDVLEHLCYNPLPVIKKLKKALSEDGKIILSTPAREIDPPPGKMDGKWINYINWKQIPEYEKYKFSDKHHHVYYFWELIELVREADMDIVEVLHTGKTRIMVLECIQ